MNTSVKVFTGLVIAFSPLIYSAHAQIANTPEIEKLVQDTGQGGFFDILSEIRKLYSDLLKESPQEGVRLVEDLAYGKNEANKLDLHHPEAKSDSLKPVLVFIHGGGFIRGSKNTTGEIFDNIGNYFARHGVVTVNADYRLAPKHKWPSGVEDIASIVSWVNKNIQEYSGDPKQIYLMGQSAGAAHVAGYVFNEDFHVNKGNDGIAGAILVSGAYPITGTPSDLAYYGEDKSKWAERSVFNMLEGRKIPVFIIDVEFDGIEMQLANVELMLKLCRRDNKCPHRMHIQGHNHVSGIYHINTADDSYGKEILDFIGIKP